MSNNNSFNLLKKQLLSPTNNAIIHNRFVLYFILFIALANLYFLTMSGDLVFTSIFVLVGFLTSFFSKNMVVILAIALAATNLIKFGLDYAKEGMENTDEQLIKEHGTGEGEGMTEKLVGQDDEEEHKEGLEDEEEHKEGLEDEEEHKEGLVNEDDEEGKNGSKNTMEGMQPLGYSSLVPNLLEDQATLFTNIGQLTPYVIKAENASIQETKMKYENFRPAK